MKIPFIGPAYQFENKPLAAQELVNYFLEIGGKDQREPVALRGCPGLKSPFTSGLNGKIRGMATFKGVHYVVAGTKFYTVASDGTATQRGTVSGSWRPFFAFNGTQVVIADRRIAFLDGYVAFPGTTTIGYTYTVSTATLAQITDASFAIASDNQFFVSNLDDASVYTATDIAAMVTTKEKCVAVVADHDQLIVVSEGAPGIGAMEFWINVGDSDFPFRHQDGAVIEYGVVTNTLVKANNTYIWLSTDNCIYMANGYSANEISTRPITEAIDGYDKTDCFAFYYTWNGHKFYCITFPRVPITWEYDLTLPPQWGWHQRQSWKKGRWLANDVVRVFNKTLVGDYNAGNIYEMDGDTYDENGEILEARRASQYIHADNKTFIFDLFEAIIESGATLLESGQGSNPKIMLQLSKDGGRTFGQERWRNMGKQGEHNVRARWRNNGKVDQAVIIKTKITDPVPRDIVGATGDLSIVG